MSIHTPTILCIDDDLETLKLRQLLLQSFGYNVVTASSGAEGLRFLSGNPGIDLVLLDYLIPGMNGDVIAERLRALYPKVPVIIVSAVAQLPNGLLRKVDGYVQKGQEPEVLLGRIAMILMSHGKGATSMQNSVPDHRTILCAEDDEEQLTARRLVFESAGFSVLAARSGKEALEMFRREQPDAVVLDYWMPGMKGLTVAREMKQLRPKIPILVLSGLSALPGEIVGAADAWLQKRDVEPDALLAEVNRLIEATSAKSSE
jgi:CheY-like chemotaxis protein